ncbi:MAG: biotin/lipoyl-binding protein [Polyangiaceae bacterium]|nr:biotin/lipoyl-binding protein [Polyangiaceae bacterium]
MRYFVTIEGEELAVDVTALPGGGVEVLVDGREVPVDVAPLGDSDSLIIDGGVIDLTVEGRPPRVGVIASGKRVYLDVESARLRAARAAKKGAGAEGDGVIVSPMPGRVLKLLVAKGDEVAAGQAVAVVEAMKMENELKATRAGKVTEISAEVGAAVEAGAKLVTIA